MRMTAALAKLAATALSDERVRKGVGCGIAAILSPLILFVTILCSFASGGADHNTTAVEACFYGTAFSDDVPTEFRTHVAEMQDAFSLLDY